MAGKQKNMDDFWRDYAEKTGETVLARGMGQYVHGWDLFDDKHLWGLIIATTGGFRFHHFPQVNWLSSIMRFGSEELPKEKTIFIPAESIVSVTLQKETKWYRKLFAPSPPQLIIRYRTEAGQEKELLLLADYKLEEVAEELRFLIVQSTTLS